MQDTRVDILNDIRRWYRADHGNEKPVYCISGLAGTGKSTIAYTMAEEWLGEGCFCFFFSQATHGARALCISLATQIVAVCSGLNWDEYWAELRSDLSSPIAWRVSNLWEKLVSHPLEKCAVHRRHVLVVDALDECDQASRVVLLECLLQTCTSNFQSQVRLLLTTRKEEDILRVLEMDAFRYAMVHRSLEYTENSRADIARYVDYRLNVAGVTGLEPSQREQLVDRCGGLFVFASLACDMLQSHPQTILQNILKESTSLDTLYYQTLSQVGNSSKYVRARLMDILRIILVVREPISIATIAGLLSISVDIVKMVVQKLGSILSSGDVDQPVYILHVTLREFLLQETLIEREMDATTGNQDTKEIRNMYYINEVEGERAMLKGCLNVMRHGLVFNICSLETSFLLNEEFVDMDNRIRRYITSALLYSCLNWTSHLKLATYDTEILTWLEEFINTQFLSWLEVLSVTKCVRFASKMLVILIEWMQVSFWTRCSAIQETELTCSATDQ